MGEFEPWLSRVEAMEAGTLWRIAEEVPPEWYGGDTRTIERLMEQMLARRGRVRELIGSFRTRIGRRSRCGRRRRALWCRGSLRR